MLQPFYLLNAQLPVAYTLHPVISRKDEAQWLEVARVIYAHDPNWVAPLDMDLKATFNPAKNFAFDRGEAMRWYLTQENGRLAGRIAAFYDRERAKAFAQPTGGIGFFECVDDSQAAAMLFDAAKSWLASKGMEAMDGPVNFGENDRFNGLLVGGFEQPSFGMNYQLPYYQHLFTDYGWEVFFEQISSDLDVSKPMPERFLKVEEWVKRKGIVFKIADKRNLEVFAQHFREVYNEAWQAHEHFAPMSAEQATRMAMSLKHIIIERFAIFAYVEDEPAGFLLALPDLNQILKPFKGKPTWWQLLLLSWRKRDDYAWYRKRGILNRVRIIVIGVKPKFRRYGLEAGLIMHNIPEGVKMGTTNVDLSWIGDFNPMMLSLMESTGAKPARTHHTYRYLFDRSKAVVREKQIGSLKRD